MEVVKICFCRNSKGLNYKQSLEFFEEVRDSLGIDLTANPEKVKEIYEFKYGKPTSSNKTPDIGKYVGGAASVDLPASRQDLKSGKSLANSAVTEDYVKKINDYNESRKD